MSKMLLYAKLTNHLLLLLSILVNLPCILSSMQTGSFSYSRPFVFHQTTPSTYNYLRQPNPLFSPTPLTTYFKQNNPPFFPSSSLSQGYFDYLHDTEDEGQEDEGNEDFLDSTSSFELPAQNQYHIIQNNNFHPISVSTVNMRGPTTIHFPSSINYTEINVFYPEDEICCSGKVVPKPYGRCCGSKSTIDVTYQACCDGAVHDLKVGFACCGKQYFDVRKQICCRYNGISSIKDLPLNLANEYKYFRCCSRIEVYDTRTHICCISSQTGRQTVFAKEKGSLCQQSNKHNVGFSWRIGTSTSGIYICNNQEYNPETQLCCSKIITKTNPREMCCLDRTYDPQQEICCADMERAQSAVHPKARNGTAKCCGTSLYDPNTQYCCGRKGNGPFDNWPFYKGLYMVMDLPASIPEHSAVCCKDSQGIVKGTFHLQKQICCDGKIIEKLREKTVCCGQNGMNPDTHHCCKGTAFPVSDMVPSRWMDFKVPFCCFDSDGRATGLINTGMQRCCDGAIFNISNNKHCCGKQLYSHHEGMCCNGIILKRENPNQQCCGSEIYDSQNQICCPLKMQVLKKGKANDNSCCGNSTYDRSIELCCESNGESAIHPKLKRRELCCGTAVIQDRHTQMCCQRVDFESKRIESAVVAKTSGAKCCGLLAYHKNSEICCKGTVISKGNRTKVKCCGQQSYDLNNEKCCGGQIHSFPGTAHFRRCCGVQPYDRRNEVCCAGKVKQVDVGRLVNCCMG